MIDSHTHLVTCEPADAELVAEAVARGVTRLLTVGMDSETNRASLATAEDFPQVFVAIGRHPNVATGFDEADLAELRALAAHPRCVAIGETGLDFFRQTTSREDQERAFAAQIGLARETGKPLIIHTRAAEEDTLSMLGGQADGIRVVLHCFSMPERIEQCVERGYWISFAGNVTYPANAALREACRRVPDDRLLVETDAPYLSPQPVRKQRNVPANVVLTAEVVAAERGVSYADLSTRVERTAAELFGW